MNARPSTRRLDAALTLPWVTLFLVPSASLGEQFFAASRQVDTGTPPSFDPGTGDHAVAQGDFNGDGTPDVIFFNPRATPENITVFPVDGEGSLATPVITEFGEAPSQGVVGDFDEDGLLDVAGSLYFWSDEISQAQIFLGAGDGTFSPGVAFGGAVGPAGDNLLVTAAADFDKDGHMDLVLRYPGLYPGYQEIWFGDGTGGMSLHQTISEGVSGALSADANGDGWPDLVGIKGTAAALLNQGDGTLGPAIYSPGVGGIQILPTHLDGDGVPDVVMIGYTGFDDPWSIRTALGLGDGTFSLAATYPVIDGQYGALATADFDGDGTMDIVAGVDKAETILLRGTGDGVVFEVRRYLAGGLYYAPIHLDVDGRVDLVAGGVRPGQMTVTLGSSTGLAGAPITEANWLGTVMAAGDLNGDGRNDLVTSHKLSVPPGVSVLIAGGAGGYEPAVTYTLSREGRALALGDLNSDGYDDLVVGSASAGGFNLEILLGSSTGAITHHADLNNGSATVIYGSGLALEDMDGDADLDIVTTTFGPLSVLPNQGNATFSTAIQSGRGAGSVSTILLRDFNADGTPDAVAVWDSLDPDFAQSSVEVNLGVGDGSLTHVQTLSLGVRVAEASAGLFDTDALPDVVVGGLPGLHAGVGGLFVLRNVGGAFALDWQLPGLSILELGVGDFTGDGRGDIVASHGENVFFQGSDLEVWINDGAGTFGSSFLLPSPLSPSDLTVADLAGDGAEDFAVLSSFVNPSSVVFYENLQGGVPTGVETLGPSLLSSAPDVLQAWPNPLNPETILRYELPRAGDVRLDLHDVLGRRIATLVDARQGAGHHEVRWDGTSSLGIPLVSGVYFARLRAEGVVAAQKLIVTR